MFIKDNQFAQGNIDYQRKEGNYSAGFGIVKMDLPQLEQNLYLLHNFEKEKYNQIKFPKRKESYLLGRLAGRTAVSKAIQQTDSDSFYITNGVFQFPVVKSVSSSNIQVSISHCEEIGVAVAFPEEHPLGIDIEKIVPEKLVDMKSQCTEKELKLFIQNDINEASSLPILWTAKECLSKVLRTGLTTDFKLFEISSIVKAGALFISEYHHFAQYKCISYIVDQYAVSIACPKNSKADLNLFQNSLQNILSSKV